MTDEQKSDETGAGEAAGGEQQAGQGRQAGGEQQSKARSRSGRMGDGIRQGIGVLSAFKEALEETIQEARDRGDLSTDRAKEVMREALDRAQSAAEDARERFDFAPQGEVDRTRSDIEALKAAFEALQVRVRALEEQVLGDADAGEGGSSG